VREELIKFHKEHYSANLMKLVVLGKEDIDTLHTWVTSLFSNVPNTNKPLPSWLPHQVIIRYL
jgi:insulysin